MRTEKSELIRELMSIYHIKTAGYIQSALKDLFGETTQDMLQAELNEHLVC